jgi:hypothetical protein
MGLKEKIENNPVSILIGVVIATASATSGLVNYIDTSRFDNEVKKVELEVAQLKTKIASIRRRLGNEDDSYFDVAQLVIPRDQIRTLDKNYVSITDGAFFFVPPTDKPWAYSFISEGELAALKLDADFAEKLKRTFATGMAQKNTHLWRGTPDFTVAPTPRKGMEDAAMKEMTFFPMVVVQIADEETFKNFDRDLSGSSNGDEATQPEAPGGQYFNDAEKLISEISKESRSASTPILDVTRKSEEAEKTLSTDISRSADAKLRMEKLLNNLYRGDMAVLTLQVLIMGSLQIPAMFSNVKVELNNIQKKGNVLYVQMSMKLGSVRLAGQDKLVNLTVDREIFVVSSSDKHFIVQVEVPSTDGRSDAYSWVSQWLNSIRIPV